MFISSSYVQDCRSAAPETHWIARTEEPATTMTSTAFAVCVRMVLLETCANCQVRVPCCVFPSLFRFLFLLSRFS